MGGIVQNSEKLKPSYLWGRLREKASDISGMLGSKGAKVHSQTIKSFPGGGRIDIENPAPGVRPGQLHYQKQGDPNKYYHNRRTGKFHIGGSNGPIASSSIQKLLNDSDFYNAMLKGYRFLDGN